MKDDPIVAEVRRVREAHAARFNYNLRAIYEDIKKQEQGCAQELHRLPAKRVEARAESELGGSAS